MPERCQGVNARYARDLESLPSFGHRRTRAFYYALGFIPLEETTAF